MSDKQAQDELKTSLNKIWLAGLGALQVAEEESSKLFSNLVEKGKEYETKGRAQAKEVSAEIKAKVEEAASKVEEAAKKVRGEASGTFGKFEDRMDAAITSSLGRLGVPSRDEIATLTQRVEELTRVVEKLKTPAPAKATAAKKASPRKTATKTATKTAAKKADSADEKAN
jgi:poly(hydroxyalkanoate) granule-associated protein